MKFDNRSNIVAVMISAIVVFVLYSPCLSAAFPEPPVEKSQPKGEAVAVFAGGCFWGIEAVFESLKGVKDVVSGYSGGNSMTAHYEIVSTGSTGHAESVKVTYDPSVVSFGTLLKIFFSIAHDPTEFNYQGPDQGSQYRSVIFYSTDEQKKTAEEYIRILTKAKVYDKPIVTNVDPLKAFYPAEAYHQHFLRDNPDSQYIQAWDMPKLEALRKTYPKLVSGK
jgi:peptide-methionine (S)-S-oxide reductase